MKLASNIIVGFSASDDDSIANSDSKSFRKGRQVMRFSRRHGRACFPASQTGVRIKGEKS